MDAEERLVMVITTTETRADADQLSREILGHHLAACVQIDGPIASHYYWAGEPRASDEFRLMIKTRRGVWETLKEKLLEWHPYDEPEIIVVDIVDASSGYRSWVIDQTS